MKFKFLGTGTSQGVPVIGCECEVCTSADPRDQRLRSSGIITTAEGRKILIDCGPDFRQQMLRHNEHQVDAVLITHEHNDHVIGLDDLRPLIFKKQKNIDLYCQKRVIGELRARFPYAFTEKKYPGAPSFNMHEIIGDFQLFDVGITPVHLMHYYLPIVGFKFKKFAYLTDASEIHPEEKEKLKDLDHLVINCIRKTDPHPAHFILPQVIELFAELRPREMYLTHLSHHIGLHEITQKELPPQMYLAYDGLEISF